MSNIAGVALFTAALFLLVVAVMLNSPALFYMSTAMVATILAARFQAYQAVRNLSFTRRTPGSVRVGELVEVELVAKGEGKRRRPLVRVIDHLPAKLLNETVTSSTPIAPANGEPVVTKYRFRPSQRGIFSWSRLSVIGYDALGIVAMEKEYAGNPVELVVLPNPVVVPFSFGHASGWGTSEAEQGLSRGAGIEPRGIREYTSGDSMRYVHWRSTAKTGQLVVKEFETGSNAVAAFFVQNTAGSEIGEPPRTTTELMCGHLAYILARGIRQGVAIQFPALELPSRTVAPSERELEILKILAGLNGESPRTLSQEIDDAIALITPGASVYLVLSITDTGLPSRVAQLKRNGHSVFAMIYDAALFPGKKRADSIVSAAETDYRAELLAAGAAVRLMPLDGLGK